MSPRPHEGPAEEGLSSSLLPIVQDTERIENLRSVMSGFCHRCRNSLNGIKMSLYLFRREARGGVPNCWGEIESMYQQVEQLFDHLQTIYRPMPIRTVRSPLDELIRLHVPKWRSWYESRGLGLSLAPPESEVVGDLDPIQLGLGLDALATSRARAGRAGIQTCIGWEVRDGSIELRWQEGIWGDAPGPPGGDVKRPTCEGDPPLTRANSLALPLLARIVVAHGGCLDREPGPGFGVRLRWPQFRDTLPEGAA